jgi:hypothetical protein
MRRRLLVFLLLLGAVALQGQTCRGGRDLQVKVPTGAPGNETGYCKSPNLVAFVIVSYGSEPTPGPIKVRIEFLFTNSPPPTNVTVGDLGAGATSEVQEVPIPTGCFGPDCVFRITVDPDNGIEERNETNNQVNGRCIG